MRDFDAIKKKEMNSIENRVRHVYNIGYETGYADGTKVNDGERGSVYYGGYGDGYKQGLEDAWACCRRFLDADDDLCAYLSVGNSWCDFFKLSPSEAIAKMKEYDEKTSDDPDNSKIEVGDVVETNGFSKPVIVISTTDDLDSSAVKVMNFFGDTAWKDIKNCKKTGKHIQQIEEVFNMLRDNKNA